MDLGRIDIFALIKYHIYGKNKSKKKKKKKKKKRKKKITDLSSTEFAHRVIKVNNSQLLIKAYYHENRFCRVHTGQFRATELGVLSVSTLFAITSRMYSVRSN